MKPTQTRRITLAINAAGHYENFPVASMLVPAPLRPAITAVYRFARHADDLADEGDAPAPVRLAALDALAADLRAPAPLAPVVAELHPHLRAHGLPVEPFEALLSAFRQDVTSSRQPDFASLAHYCSRSADPVGEIVLRLFGAWHAGTRVASSQVCTALQLINFVQDLAPDWRRGRLYVPLDELAAAGLSERDNAAASAAGRASAPLRALVRAQAARARAMLCAGVRALVPQVPRRLGWELRAVAAGGLRILDRLARQGDDPFAARPSLGWRDAAPLAALWWRIPA